jgi:hypothetical protein
VGLPPSPVEFSSHCPFYKLSCSWLLGVCCCSCLLQPSCLFTVLWGISPPPLLGAQGIPPSLLPVFFVIAYCSVSLFSLGGESICPGGYADLAQGCLWEYRVPLSSPCGLHLPKRSGHWCLPPFALTTYKLPFEQRFLLSVQSPAFVLLRCFTFLLWLIKLYYCFAILQSVSLSSSLFKRYKDLSSQSESL